MSTTAESMLAMGTANGGRNLGLPVGRLDQGCFADFVVMDLNDLSMQPRQNIVKNLVYASQPSAIKQVFVHGKRIYEDGRLLNMPEEAIVERVRATTGSWG